MRKNNWSLYLILGMLTVVLTGANRTKNTAPPSRPPARTPTTSSTPTAPAEGSGGAANPFGRSVSINFEDEIVEGMNKNPFDSLTNIGKKDDRSQKKLYRKKTKFGYEIKLTIREMGLLQ